MTITHLPSTQTLVSNTGSNSQPDFQVAIDWLDITFSNLDGADNARQIVKDFEELTTDQIDFNPSQSTFNGHQWDGCGRGVKGTLLWYQARRSDAEGHPLPAKLKIALSGSVLAQTDVKTLAFYVTDIASHFQPECSRIDIALDDLKKFIKMGRIADAMHSGDYFNTSYTAEIVSGNRGEPKGTTLYFGAPSSDKRLCIYDKTIESKGKLDANRWEARYRRKAANQVFHVWVQFERDAPESVPRLLQNYVLGLVDFRNRDGNDPNRARCEPLRWYSDLCRVLRAKPARVTVKAVVQTIQKSIDWTIKAVAPTLFTLKAALGDHFPKFFEDLIKKGADRMSNTRRRALKEANRAELCY